MSNPAREKRSAVAPVGKAARFARAARRIRFRMLHSHSLVEAIMKFRSVILLACTCLALSACVVEPYRDRGYYYSGNDDHRDHDDGHRVWRD